MPRMRVFSYDRLLRSRRLPQGTWIFTDFDRLGAWDLELAAHVCQELRAAGMQVLNSPAMFLGRFDLLRCLHARGINSFMVWRAYELDAIERWPVFLRTEAAHRGVLSDLISTRAELEQNLQKFTALGYPLRDLMVVEYCAEPLASGVFRKYAAYRVGERIFPALGAHEPNWVAKFGKHGAASAADYEQELAAARAPCEHVELRQAFDIAGLQYGRLDYGMVDGRIQVYEINSNPFYGKSLKQHPYATRLQTAALIDKYLAEALQAIDVATGRAARIKDPLLARQRLKDLRPAPDWLWRRSRWMA